MILQNIGVLSAAKVFGAVYAGVGLILGAIFSLVGILQSIFMGAAGGELGGLAPFGMLFGVGAIIVLPIVYGVMGFLSGALGAFIYNLVSGAVGGLELRLTEKPVIGAFGSSPAPSTLE